MNNSNYYDFYIKFSHEGLKNQESDVIRIYDIYLNHLIKKKKFKNNLIDIEAIKEKNKIWILCDPLINSFNCTLNFDFKYNVLKDIDLYKLNLKLIEIKI